MTSTENNDTFQFVLIPANSSEPIQQLEGSKAGGLENDYLSDYTKKYFNPTTTATTDPSNNNSIWNFQTREITALTVPTPLNNHLAVSMYSDDNARNKELPYNHRAALVMKACGYSIHPNPPEKASPHDDATNNNDYQTIFGDVFLGRCKDDEIKDIWERVDFTIHDIPNETNMNQLEWCRTARKKGGGGRGAASSAASLSSIMSQYANNAGVGGGGSASGFMGSASGGRPISSGYTVGETVENGYRWSQNEDEVEVKFSVAPGTKAKYVKVKFSKNSLKVSVAGQTLMEGETYSDVDTEGCTYTIQDDKDSSTPGGRELCVTIAKKNGDAWNYVIM